MLSGDHTNSSSNGTSFLLIIPSFILSTKSIPNGMCCFHFLNSNFAVVPRVENDQISASWSYQYPTLRITTDKYWLRTATQPLFWDEFSFGINHRDHHALFIASFNYFVRLIELHNHRLHDQVHGTFDALTDSFDLPAVGLYRGVGWRSVNHFALLFPTFL